MYVIECRFFVTLMFKKPLGNLKTSAPLSGSDRRKFKQRVIAAFAICPEDGDQLVPEGIQSVKFSTHLNEQGVAYLGLDGDPLWLTIGGKGSDELIPSIYTLWKKRDLLPIVFTPPSVIPVLVGGADLMIPGVIHRPPSIGQGQLVSVCWFNRNDEKTTLSPPLAVGRMAIPADQMTEDAKGKAVLVLHTWKDHLWDMGSKIEVPEPTVFGAEEADAEEANKPEAPEITDPPPPTNGEQQLSTTYSYTPQESTEVLHKSLLQAISTTLSTLPASSFPILSTQFYTNHILPNRPAYPALILQPTSSSSALPNPTKEQLLTLINPQDITIKSSTYKSLTAFLKVAEKTGLVALKSPHKHSQQTDLLVMSVNAKHSSVMDHIAYATMRQVEEKTTRKTNREGEKELDERSEVLVKVLWKPHLGSVSLFEGLGGDPEALYTMQQVKSLLNKYISSNNLVNPNDQVYINMDTLLSECINSKSHPKKKQENMSDRADVLGEFMKREELLKGVIQKMQDWYEIGRDGGEVVQKKGTLKPIQVVTKARQGRKASTTIMGFEPFLVIDAEVMADELRKSCASATSVSQIAGKQGGTEVMVQGKQSKAVVEYLTSSGVPKQWIEVR
ncbi:hypothetical protein AX15_002748 [Amanita polypyramis BW_CC]|nr:hypothetical protein AX15_002748 [Amanita polypyramis BW_CC]